MRVAVSLMAGMTALWLAGAAGAGCFAADELPARAIYDGGSVLEYLGRDGDVLTYRSGKTTSRMKDGLWPLDHKGEGFSAEYDWETELPGLAAVIAAGGKARVEGRMKQGKSDWVPVAAEVEILGEKSVDWEDCRYKAIEFRKTIHADGKKVSEGVMLYAPDAMISFRSDSVDVATGAVFSHALVELE